MAKEEKFRDRASFRICAFTALLVNVNPVMVVIDKEILEHYGQAIPDYENWTMAGHHGHCQASTTGTDPVTGKQTYGMSIDRCGKRE